MTTAAEPPEPPYRTDGACEVNQADIYRILLTEPAARNYAITAAAALAMIFLVMMEQGSDLGGILIVMVGLCGILFRFVMAPFLLIAILTYFMWTPTGTPFDGYSYRWRIEERRFQFGDVLLTLSVMLYLISYFRVQGLIRQAMAFAGAVRHKNEPVIRRPIAVVSPTELGTMLAMAVGLVILGQVLWLLATSLEVVPQSPLPLKLADRPRVNEVSQRFLPLGISRFIVLTGILFFGGLIARLFLGYWKLKTLSRAEARMILMDAGWRETHRERTRLEKWRFWGRKRSEQSEKDRSIG